MWGYNSSGELGDNSTIDSSSPVQIGSFDEWAKISNGNAHSVFIKSDGTLWSAGDNSYGQIGINDLSTQFFSSPVQEILNKQWVSATTASNCTIAIDFDGFAWSWGQNNTGQLGQNDTANKSTPVQISSAKWKSISNNYYFTIGIQNDGSLWFWGYNSYGRFGDSTYPDGIYITTRSNWFLF